MTLAPLASSALGDAISGAGGPPPETDVQQTIISQYANSSVITGIINRWASAFDQSVNVDAFFNLIWNVETAQDYGLDVLGRIVGVGRVIKIPDTVPYIGWASDAFGWGQGIWFGLGNATKNYALSDDAFRQLVLAKAALNICDGSIPAINQVLLALFPDRANCYVQDNGGMSLTYVFGSGLTPVEYAIVTQSGVLPKPVGVTAGASQP